jgi:DNA modification methylase
MHVSLTPTLRVIPYARNPRKNQAAVAKVAASIREFGWRQPIVVDSNMVVIVGHTRLLAAQQLGLEAVPVHVAEGLTDAQVKAYRLADNRTHEEAEWDNDLLAIELGALKDANFDLGLTGFDAEELEALLNDGLLAGLTDEDAIPETPETAISRLGDVWILGEHRLLCGDATSSDAYARLLGGNPVDMVFTDPPYNVNYGETTKGGVKADRKILNDHLGEEFYSFLLAACQNAVKHCKGAMYICMSCAELNTLQRAFREAGGHWSTFIIWAKNTFTLGRADYQRQYEPILYGWPEGNKHFWCGARDQGDVWFFNKPRTNDLHPTMKPVELVQRAIENSSKTRDTVLDCFGGSGSTLIACEKTHRVARLMECDPKYCDVIVTRWQDFTGKKATNANGTPFGTLPTKT